MSFVSTDTDPAPYSEAVKALNAGEVAILPTETVYGLAARADDQNAVNTVFSIKARPKTQTLPVCVFSEAQAEKFAIISPMAKPLMDTFWPGPLTLVLPVKPHSGLSPQLIAADNTIALRVPDIGWRDVFAKSGLSPLALTSANISGAPSPVRFDQIDATVLKQIGATVNDGPCREGLASTILRVTDDGVALLREGALKAEAFAAFDMNWIDG